MRRIIALLFFVAYHSNAQNTHQITGQVFDQDDTVVTVGDALLFIEGSETLVKYATILEGHFTLEDVPIGDYQLQVSALGFETYKETFSLTGDHQFFINLKEATTQLSEVEVVAAKNPIEYKSGNLKVDVQNPYFSSIPNPIDLLSRLPNVQVAPDRESISILGKGNPLIYLGNQRISMEEFVGLPIDGIATIELINNPSAKYEAEGRAVLLISLKKNTQLGFRGSVSETVSSKQNFNNYLDFNSSYASNDWTFRGNLAYNQLLQWESNSFLFEIPARDVAVDYTVLVPRNDRLQLNAGFGTYFQWNETDYVSLNTTLRLQTDDAPIVTDTFLRDGAEQFIKTDTGNDQTKNYYSASFNFNKKLSDSWNLFTGVQSTGFSQTLSTEIANNIDNSEFVMDQKREQEYDIHSLALRLDLEKALSQDYKWESGINLSQAKADAFTEIQDLANAEETIIDFSYEEKLYAAYSSVSGKLSKKIDFELGMRIEYNKVDGSTVHDGSPIVSRGQTNLFPKANVSVALDSSQTLNLNYGRSIRRPDFSRASSITVFINPFLEGAGNVNLIPTRTNEVSLNYQKKNKTLFMTYYQSADPMNFTISYDETNDRAILSQVNLDKEIGVYAGVTLPFSKGIWTSNNTISLNYNKLKDDDAGFSTVKPFVYTYTNHQLKIAKDTTLVLGAWGMGRRQEGIFKRNGLAVFEASISKTLFSNWDCTLRFNDITRAMNFEERYAINRVIADGVYYADGREVALSLKYRFGNKKSTDFKNRDVDSNLERIN
ncbi:TonB-dependent receptor domain-containing protein [Flagellimonas sp.]|uniref:TonB-dependent receptor domain-containing protein n=1 Tax=Flagellimonas sp. TaxID=2058762 RepID=UPI003BAFA52B